jgi:hypothetical protein
MSYFYALTYSKTAKTPAGLEMTVEIYTFYRQPVETPELVAEFQIHAIEGRLQRPTLMTIVAALEHLEGLGDEAKSTFGDAHNFWFGGPP